MVVKSIQDIRYLPQVLRYPLTPTERITSYLVKLAKLSVIYDQLMNIADKHFTLINPDIGYAIKDTVEKILDLLFTPMMSTPVFPMHEESEIKYNIHLINLSLVYGMICLPRDSLKTNGRDLFKVIVSDLRTISDPVPYYLKAEIFFV